MKAPPKTSADKVHELPLSQQIRFWRVQVGTRGDRGLERALECCAELAEKLEALEAADAGPKCGAV